jgi:hypothetical protein
VATTGAATAKEKTLPRSATITIRDQAAKPSGKVEVAPWTGRVHFANKDKKDYRLRFWRPGTDPLAGIDLLLPAKGSVTVMIKRRDEFHYGVFNVRAKGEEAFSGRGGGPIVN